MFVDIYPNPGTSSLSKQNKQTKSKKQQQTKAKQNKKHCREQHVFRDVLHKFCASSESKQVLTWCFTPSQPSRLYQGEVHPRKINISGINEVVFVSVFRFICWVHTVYILHEFSKPFKTCTYILLQFFFFPPFFFFFFLFFFFFFFFFFFMMTM